MIWIASNFLYLGLKPDLLYFIRNYVVMRKTRSQRSSAKERVLHMMASESLCQSAPEGDVQQTIGVVHEPQEPGVAESADAHPRVKPGLAVTFR